MQQFLDLRTFARPCAVTLTMKKGYLGEKNDHIRASTNYRHFSNRLNAVLLGTKAKRYGCKLKTIPVIESNADGRLHYHAVIDRPATCSFTEFEQAVRRQWLRTNFGYYEMDVQDAATSGWTAYMLKFRQKASLLDSIDWENCHLTVE